MARFTSESLSDRHILDRFESGVDALDTWLVRSARHAQAMRTARTYVWHGGDDVVVAYYSIAAHLVYRRDLPKKVGRGSPDRIPAILLARLALDRTLQGRGLGAALLRGAAQLVARIAEQVGARVLVVDAVDEQASAFYRRFGFISVRDQPARLFQKIRDIEAALTR